MFIVKLLMAAGLVVLARYLNQRLTSDTRGKGGGREAEDNTVFLKAGRMVSRMCTGVLILWAFTGTSFVWVSSGHIATLKRVYFAKSLPPGRIVGLDGELGPQARILTAGFHVEFFITLLYQVGSEEVFAVPNGKCAIISAKDGSPPQGGAAFADPWSDSVKQAMVNDATYFLTQGKGQRGPQTTVLTPGSYTINPFLWEKPRLIDAIRVEQGTEGVVKSSVRAAVDFGSFRRPMPTNNVLTVLTGDKLPKGSVGALLVPVGGIGVWEEPLPNGLFYINTDAYKVTMIPTTALVFEYKGGYKRRTVDISVDDQGKITERVAEAEVQATPQSADTAIFTKPEGWDVAQELRVLVQVFPGMGPYVVASLGLTEANAAQVMEDRVVTPIIRSVTRDVEGGAQIEFTSQKAALDTNGIPLISTNGMPLIRTVREFRTVRVMDLIENRNSVENAIEERARPEALKEGINIVEVRLSESSIPAELLIARKREQLAQQLSKAWAQEEIAQTQRQKTENARAQAVQQSTLVTADMEARAAKKRAEGRTTLGEGEKAYMLAVAEGQKAQSQVLGQEATVKLQIFQHIIAAAQEVIQKNPEILAKALDNAHKFVPSVVVSGGGSGGGGIEGAAAIFGHLMSKDPVAVKTTSK